MAHDDSMALLSALLGVDAGAEGALLSSLAAASRSQSLAPRELLVRPGETLAEVLLVRRGLLRFFHVREDGAEWTKAYLREGEATGPFVGGADDWPAPLGIQSVERSELAFWSWSSWSEIAAKHPRLERWAAARAAAILERKSRRLLSLQGNDAATRYEEFLREEPELAARLPQREIASYLGMTAESLSRLKRQLRRRASGGRFAN